MRRSVFIEESEDDTGAGEDGLWLTGRFEGYLDGWNGVLESFERRRWTA